MGECKHARNLIVIGFADIQNKTTVLEQLVYPLIIKFAKVRRKFMQKEIDLFLHVFRYLDD